MNQTTPYQTFFRDAPRAVVMEIGNGGKRTVTLIMHNNWLMFDLDTNIRLLPGLDDQTQGMIVVKICAWVETPEDTPIHNMDPPNVTRYGETSREYFDLIMEPTRMFHYLKTLSQYPNILPN